MKKGWGQSVFCSSVTKNSNLKITSFQKERFSYISWKENQKHWIHDSTGQGKIKTCNFKKKFQAQQGQIWVPNLELIQQLTSIGKKKKKTFLAGRYFIKLL